MLLILIITGLLLNKLCKGIFLDYNQTYLIHQHCECKGHLAKYKVTLIKYNSLGPIISLYGSIYRFSYCCITPGVNVTTSCLAALTKHDKRELASIIPFPGISNSSINSSLASIIQSPSFLLAENSTVYLPSKVRILSSFDQLINSSLDLKSTIDPSIMTKFDLTYVPTIDPTTLPTTPPLFSLTNFPTEIAYYQTEFPTNSPSNLLTNYPTLSPSFHFPIYSPSYPPTLPFNNTMMYPTNLPTAYPTNTTKNNLTSLPIINPTNSPIVNLCNLPTKIPSNLLTRKPLPTSIPKITPTIDPSILPTINPNIFPSTNLTGTSRIQKKYFRGKE